MMLIDQNSVVKKWVSCAVVDKKNSSVCNNSEIL